MNFFIALCVLAQFSAISLTVECRSAVPECDVCKQEMELGIVFDSSSSIGWDDFKEGQNFLKEYLKYFEISPSAVRVSLISFGRVLHTEDAFNLTTYRSYDGVAGAVDRLTHHGTTRTNTGDAIAFMRDYQLNRRLARPGVVRVGVVITDGNSQEQELTATEAMKARYEGITMFAVGVGHQIDIQELLNIAGDDSRTDRVDNYSKLVTITKWLADMTCVNNTPSSSP